MSDSCSWRWHRLEWADEALLQGLLEACSDFHLLAEGQPAGPQAAHGRLVGVLDAVRGFPDSDVAYLGLMLLHPAWRQRGWGPQLLAALEQWARENGCRFLRLGVVEQNARGHRFWHTHGFQELFRRLQTFGRRESVVIVMQKSLR